MPFLAYQNIQMKKEGIFREAGKEKNAFLNVLSRIYTNFSVNEVVTFDHDWLISSVLLTEDKQNVTLSKTFLVKTRCLTSLGNL